MLLVQNANRAPGAQHLTTVEAFLYDGLVLQHHTHMNHRLATACVSLALATTSVLPALAQDQFANVEIKTTEVATNIYLLEGAGGNIGLCTGDDGAFVIDDQFAPLAGKILAAIEKVTDEPVTYVLNTHHHGDHTGGNEAMTGEGATVVAHENVRKRLEEERGEDALPVITFNDTVTFHWNGQEILVKHVPPAHTDGDSIVFFKEANVIHMGDVFFNGAFPFVDVGSGGDLDGYIAAQEMVLDQADDDTTIIPGHGPLAKKADLKKMNDMLKDVRSRIQKAIDEGKSEDETVEADPLKDLSETYGNGFIDGERMTRSAYQSLTK